MGQRLSLDTIGVLSHSSGTLSLAASKITIGGQQYITTAATTRLISTDVTLVANTRYQVYAVISGGVVALRVSANENSVGPAGFTAWCLAGSFITGAAAAFGTFVNITGRPEYNIKAIYQAVSTSVSANTIINFATLVKDTNGSVTTGASWKFTAPVTAYYSLSSTITAASSGTGGAASYYTSLNGTRALDLRNSDGASGSFSGDGSIFMTAGDFIDFRLGSSFGSASSANGYSSQTSILFQGLDAANAVAIRDR